MATGGSPVITESLHSGSYIGERLFSFALAEGHGKLLCLGWLVPFMKVVTCANFIASHSAGLTSPSPMDQSNRE